MVLKKKNSASYYKTRFHHERKIRTSLHFKKRKEIALLWLALAGLLAFASTFIFSNTARITGLAVLQETQIALTGEIGLWLGLLLAVIVNAFVFSRTWNKRRIVRIRKDYILRKKHHRKR